MSKELEEIFKAGQETAAKHEKIRMAMRMLADCIKPELVAKYADLPLDDVRALEGMVLPNKKIRGN